MITKEFTVPIDVQEVDVRGAIECGLHQEWILATSEDLNVELSNGVASPWMQVSTKTGDGSKRYFRMDMRTFLTKFMEQVQP